MMYVKNSTENGLTANATGGGASHPHIKNPLIQNNYDGQAPIIRVPFRPL